MRDSLLTKRCDDVAANDEEASKYQEESRIEMDTILLNRSQISVTGLSDYVTGTRTFHNIWLVTDCKNVKVW